MITLDETEMTTLLPPGDIRRARTQARRMFEPGAMMTAEMLRRALNDALLLYIINKPVAVID